MSSPNLVLAILHITGMHVAFAVLLPVWNVRFVVVKHHRSKLFKGNSLVIIAVGARKHESDVHLVDRWSQLLDGLRMQ